MVQRSWNFDEKKKFIFGQKSWKKKLFFFVQKVEIWFKKKFFFGKKSGKKNYFFCSKSRNFVEKKNYFFWFEK